MDKPNEQIAEQYVKTKGRGGIDNFGTNKKNLVKTEDDRNDVREMMGEVYVAYKMERVTSDKELKERLDAYFLMCGERGQYPTVEEMAMYTGYSQSTVWDWEVGRNHGFSSETSEVIKKAKDFLKVFDAKSVVAGKLNFLAYCFRAKNYYGMKDVQDLVLTPNNPLGDKPSPEELQRRIESSVVVDE